MRHLDRLSERFGRPSVLGGVVKVATQLAEDGDVEQLALGASLRTGAQDGSGDAQVKTAAAQLAGADFEFGVSDHIVAEMWAKWVFIATVGALTGLMRAPVGEIVAQPGGRDLGPAILAEASAVATAAGYPVPASDLASTRAAITQDGSPLTSSLSRDLADGHPTEVEPVLADLAARGATLGVPTPVLDLATLHLRIYNATLTRR